VDVGDVRNVVKGIDGCSITTYDPQDISRSIEQTISLNKRTNGRTRIKLYDLDEVAKKIIIIYQRAVQK
jgi:hypothetical protein